ncbi:MAG: M48 family metallopeptidase [Anaerolineales bacterium]|nr:M48 family metallopeptidase [Anaerolineales bacterium]
MSEIRLDPERQSEAREYARIRRRLLVVDLLIGGVYVVAWLYFGWSIALRDILLNWTNNPWILVAGFGLFFAGLYLILSLPLSYYSGYILPVRYGMSNQQVFGWIKDLIKSILIGGLLGGLILEMIYAVLRFYPETWWLIAAVFLLLFSVLLANLAPIILMPIFYKFEPLGEEYTNLDKRLLKLAASTNTRIKGVYQFDMSTRTNAANAALVGLGNTRRILLGDTLLAEFTSDEIETVLAHEIGHHVHRDIPYGILVEGVITLIGLYFAAEGLNWGVEALGLSGVADIAGLPLFMLVIGAFGLITMPMTNAYSRWREGRADLFALEVTKMNNAYASALVRLANQNLAVADPEPWVEFLLYSHPALGKRIKMANEWKPNR